MAATTGDEMTSVSKMRLSGTFNVIESSDLLQIELFFLFRDDILMN